MSSDRPARRDPRFAVYRGILNSVETKYGRLTDSQRVTAVKILGKTDLGAFKEYGREILTTTMADTLATHFGLKELVPDMDKFMKEAITEEHKLEKPPIELDIARVFGVSRMVDLKLLIQPSSLHKRAYICFDSFRKNPATSSATKFSWDYSTLRNVGDQIGVVSTQQPLRNIVKIKLYQPLVPTPASMAQLDNTHRLSILLEEFSASAHIATASRKYHWLMKLMEAVQPWTPARHVVGQIEDFNDGEFVFNPPVTPYKSFSFSFGDPTDLVSFTSDVITGTVSAYGSPTTITSDVVHGLSSTDLVYVEGFASVSGFDDGTINSDEAHIATVTSTTAFTIPIDTSSGSFTASQPVTLKLYRYRLLLTMEVTYLDYDLE
jgi:hypothetical protein